MWTVLGSKIAWFEETFGATVKYQRDPMAVLVLTAAMKRAHQLKSAAEMVLSIFYHFSIFHKFDFNIFRYFATLPHAATPLDLA